MSQGIVGLAPARRAWYRPASMRITDRNGVGMIDVEGCR